MERFEYESLLPTRYMEILGKRKESKQHELNSESKTVDTKAQPKDDLSDIVTNKSVEEESSKN